VLTGGNPGLKPEEADTLTFGVVFEPAFAPGLALGLEYYKIDITKAIVAELRRPLAERPPSAPPEAPGRSLRPRPDS
jgi:hypothetical protein